METKEHCNAVCKIAAAILSDFMTADTMEEVKQAREKVIAEYDLRFNPFNGLPCTSDEYAVLIAEYDWQDIMRDLW